MLDASPAPAEWALARKAEDGFPLPQVIAHRGFRARHPENTLAAFRGAVEAGAHALETDVHLTRDGAVVLSHDPTLQRCFGRAEAIVTLDWRELRDLRTTAPPHLPMPRLSDLLEYLAEEAPGREEIWVLLDIKVDNDADVVMRRIAETIAAVPPHPARPWHRRVMMGVWHLDYLPRCRTHCPAFPVAHIGFSHTLARRFLARPGVHLNFFIWALLVPPFGRALIRRAQRRGRAVFAWTVNDACQMRFCAREGLDGVITDDPAQFLAVRRAWVATGRRGPVESGIAWRTYAFGLWLLLVARLFFEVFARKAVRDGERYRALNRERERPRLVAAP